jgi:hypothetical protein
MTHAKYPALKPRLHKGHPRWPRAFLIACVGTLIGLGYLATGYSHAANCTISSTLVNACRPWIGAAVRGDPQTTQDSQSQVSHYEQNIGHPIDVVHFYNGVGSDVLSSDALYFANRANTYLYQNWKPSATWAGISGNNTGIDTMATSIKSLGSKKIFLTLWHEPENDVSSGGDSNCPNVTYKGTTGTVSDYRNMWAYVENRFAADGVTNVVWVMNYMSYQPWDCLVPDLWPGNNLVDWVTWDSYSTSDSSTWVNTVGRFYTILTNDNTATHDFESKPWGLGEWGDCLTTDQAHVDQYYDDAKSALDSNTYPRLKMYLNFASTSGPGAGLGCLPDYSHAGAYDPTEQQYFNHFADDTTFNDPTPTPTATPTPTPSGKVGDINGDGTVGILDLSIMLSHWGTSDVPSDINHDGTVNILDLSMLLSHWGT